MPRIDREGWGDRIREVIDRAPLLTAEQVQRLRPFIGRPVARDTRAIPMGPAQPDTVEHDPSRR